MNVRGKHPVGAADIVDRHVVFQADSHQCIVIANVVDGLDPLVRGPELRNIQKSGSTESLRVIRGHLVAVISLLSAMDDITLLGWVVRRGIFRGRSRIPAIRRGRCCITSSRELGSLTLGLGLVER